MRKTLLIGGISTALFGVVLVVLAPIVNWALYPIVEKAIILTTLDLKPQNTETWDSWVSTILGGYVCNFPFGGGKETVLAYL
jgi:hypothetical protein